MLEAHRWPIPAVLLSCGIALAAISSQDPQAPHGAVAMERQQQLLAGLVNADPEEVPPGVDPIIWEMSIPAGNEMTRARVELGRALYFDVRLSADNTVSCATCHDVTRGFTDQRMVSEGIRDQLGRRNAPTTLNAALLEPLFLDGRARDLEHQAGQPILNPIEMGMSSRDAVVEKLSGIPEYRSGFQNAYGRPLSYADIERAIAAFERTLMFLDAPFDRFAAGDTGAISAEAAKGWELYNGKGRCASCHQINSANPLGVNNRFHNVGVSARTQNFEQLARQALNALAEDDSEAALDRLALSTDLSELGRFLITRNRSEIGAFRTLQVRNVGITAPYSVWISL